MHYLPELAGRRKRLVQRLGTYSLGIQTWGQSKVPE